MEKSQSLTKRQKKSLETKKKLFNTSIALFSKHGYENVTIEQITSKSGIAKGSFYIHYKSKEDIMIEQFHKIDAFYQQWFENINTKDSATIQLFSFIKNIGMNSENLKIDVIKVVYKSQINKFTSNTKSLLDENRIYYKIIRHIVNYGQKQGEFRNDLTDLEITKLVTRWVRSIIYDWCLYDGSFKLEQEFIDNFKFVISIIKK